MAARTTSSLLALAPELIDCIFENLSPLDLVSISRVNKRLRIHALDEKRWQAFVEGHLHHRLSDPHPFLSFRDLYISHHPNWFLVQHRIWYSDVPLHGRLIYVRYNRRVGSIEGYTMVADRGGYLHGSIDWSPPAVYHTFKPKVDLDLNRPIIRLWPKARDASKLLQGRFTPETRMDVAGGGRDRMCSTFIRARNLPSNLVNHTTSLWPPLVLPSPNSQRVRNESTDSFHSLGHKPQTLTESSDATFRIRQWLEFSHFFPVQVFGSTGRVGEMCNTYGTLPEEFYRTSKDKPLQGIWVGDYSSHGCEFLVISQPDNPKPLPEKAQKAFRMWPRSPRNRSYPAGLEEDSDDSDDEQPTDVEEVAPATSAAGNQWRSRGHERNSPVYSSVTATPATTPKRRLEAIKLTGDPNIPRAEYTFIAEDVGPSGFIGYTKEDIFRPAVQRSDDGKPIPLEDSWPGAPMYRSVGHVANHGFTGESYIPSQLIMISENRLAQYWRQYHHVSFYERVDLDRLAHV